jgi:hypothetical protein
MSLPFPSPPSQNLVSYLHSHGKPFIFCDVLKTVPSLPQLGLLSQLRFVSLLTQHGYTETSTLMLFRHHTHSTAFTLTVDDFLIRYSHPSELDLLVSCLSTLYELKVHRDLPHNTYLGYTIDYSPIVPSPCMTLSCQTTSLQCCLVSVLRGGVRHHPPPSTPHLYLTSTHRHPCRPHPPSPLLPQSLTQRRHGSNK